MRGGIGEFLRGEKLCGGLYEFSAAAVGGDGCLKGWGGVGLNCCLSRVQAVSKRPNPDASKLLQDATYRHLAPLTR